MKHFFYYAFLVLMLMGNSFALYKLFTAKEEFLVRFPRLTETGFTLFRLLPVLNIVALAGLWFFKPWAAFLAAGCGLAIILLDIVFGIHYHLYVAVPATALLLFFIWYYRAYFK